MANDLSWGEIRLLTFDQPDKTRPVLLLTRSSIIRHLSSVTVAPITTTIRGIPTELPLSLNEGMKGPCVANLDSLQTVAKSRVGRYLGSLSPMRKDELRRAVLFALELR